MNLHKSSLKNNENKVLKFRSIFISDLHLGTKHSRTSEILDFRKKTDSEYLYLVGDIIDNWAMRRKWHWKQHHNDVVQKILRKARKGTRIIFIPGNHDELFRDFAGREFGIIRVRRQKIHTTNSGKRYLVLHGDEFDGVVLYARWLAYLGDQAYGWAIFVNRHFNLVRRYLGLPYWSLSSYLKRKVKRAVEFIGNFEQAVVREAHRKNVDGVICGHIHSPEMRMIDGIHYCNDGDWVESCSALVEHFDGKMELINWPQVPAPAKKEPNEHIDSNRCLASAG